VKSDAKGRFEKQGTGSGFMVLSLNNNRAIESGLQRRAQIVRDGINKDKRTVTIALSSELPVSRDFYTEILSHAEGDVDLGRLQNSHPLLWNHNSDVQIGVVEKAWLGVDKVLRCIVRFGTSKRASEVFQDVVDGIVKHCSVGYEHLRELSSEIRDGIEYVKFSWRPYEASFVAIPADPTVGVGRSHQPPRPPIVTKEEFDRQIEHLKRNKYMRTQTGEPQRAKTRLFGLSEVDAQEFSIVRAIRDVLHTGQCTGFEKEMLDEGRRVYPGMIEGNCFIPPDLIVGLNRRDPLFRDLNVTTAAQGGDFVQTTVMIPIIEILRKKMVTQRMGIQVLAGLQGNIAIPRESGEWTGRRWWRRSVEPGTPTTRGERNTTT